MNQLEKTSEETSTGNAGFGGCLRGLLHHSIGYPVVRGRGSAWADLMAGRELKGRNGVAGAVGDRAHRRAGVGCDSLVTPQAYDESPRGGSSFGELAAE